ncbi:hypothetical protein B0H19DRAFT_1069382 [Mycena capillaripes]|nr:hypothetical protein B0H19DRAFT_1069382 [Mycena capillaripes]
MDEVHGKAYRLSNIVTVELLIPTEASGEPVSNLARVASCAGWAKVCACVVWSVSMWHSIENDMVRLRRRRRAVSSNRITCGILVLKMATGAAGTDRRRGGGGRRKADVKIVCGRCSDGMLGDRGQCSFSLVEIRTDVADGLIRAKASVEHPIERRRRSGLSNDERTVLKEPAISVPQNDDGGKESAARIDGLVF